MTVEPMEDFLLELLKMGICDNEQNLVFGMRAGREVL